MGHAQPGPPLATVPGFARILGVRVVPVFQLFPVCLLFTSEPTVLRFARILLCACCSQVFQLYLNFSVFTVPSVPAVPLFLDLLFLGVPVVPKCFPVFPVCLSFYCS